MNATGFNYTGFDIQGHQVAVISKDEVAVGCVRVTREQVEKVLSFMNAYSPPKPQFQVGDFVKVLSSEHGRVPLGEHGEVVDFLNDAFNKRTVGVKFARRLGELHDLYGKTKRGHGYYFRPDELEKVG